MKSPLYRSVIVAGSWFVLSVVPRAEVGVPEFDPLGEFNDLPKMIRVQVEFIDMSHEQMTGLMFGPHASANDGELRNKVGQLVKDGKAGIVETLCCIARPGQKATSEAVEEVIYPTEYEPPQLPDNAQPKTKDGADGAKANPQDHVTGPCPSAWETRNVGPTLEIEPTITDGRIIDLRFVPKIIYHVGNTVWAEWKDEHGSMPVKMPTFYTVRINTSFSLVDGQYLMVGSVSPKSKEGVTDFSRKLMIFVKADILTVGK